MSIAQEFLEQLWENLHLVGSGTFTIHGFDDFLEDLADSIEEVRALKKKLKRNGHFNDAPRGLVVRRDFTKGPIVTKFYHYVLYPSGDPAVTVCLKYFINDGTMARGVAICNPEKERPELVSRQTGENIAEEDLCVGGDTREDMAPAGASGENSAHRGAMPIQVGLGVNQVDSAHALNGSCPHCCVYF